MLYNKVGNYIQAYFMELNEYKQKTSVNINY